MAPGLSREGIEDDRKGETVPEQSENAAPSMLKMSTPIQRRGLRAKRTKFTDEVTDTGDQTDGKRLGLTCAPQCRWRATPQFNIGEVLERARPG